MISFTRVTWYSQAAAIVLALAIFCAGFFIGRHTAPSGSLPVAVPTESTNTTAPVTVNEPDFYEQRIEGTYTGYFDQIERYGWDEDLQTCNIFVIQKGEQRVIDEIRDAINEGNGLSTLSTNDEVRINLPFEMPAAARTEIEQSTASNPITIELIKEPAVNKGVGPCYSLFSFVRIVR